jgi:hypothetical protein
MEAASISAPSSACWLLCLASPLKSWRLKFEHLATWRAAMGGRHSRPLPLHMPLQVNVPKPQEQHDRPHSSLRRTSTSTGALRANRAFFKMHVMSVQQFLELDSLVPHEVGLSAGTVMEVPPDASVIFVSHQWLSVSAPDPACVQLRALQQMLRTLVVQGDVDELFEPDEWAGFATGVNTRKFQLVGPHAQAVASLQKQITPEAFCEEVSNAFIWLDCTRPATELGSSAHASANVPSSTFASSLADLSIPQARDGIGAATNQLNAIRSIPYYIERVRKEQCTPSQAHHGNTPPKDHNNLNV